MAVGSPTILSADWTVDDLLQHLGVPADRIRLQPPPGTATQQDVLDVKRRTGRLCELVDGILVEKGMGYYESVLACILVQYLNVYLEKHPLGLTAGEGGMLEVLPEQVRIPDVSFIRWDRFPGGRPSPSEPIPAITPELAVEILSRGNTEREMQRKLREYFAGGAQLVWYIDPRTRSARVYTSPESFSLRTEDQSIDGGVLLPGFEFRLAELFARAEQRMGD